MADRDAVLALARQVKEEVGDVTILVNNAGIMHCHPLVQHNPQEIRRTFEINVFAHFWVSFEQFSSINHQPFDNSLNWNEKNSSEQSSENSC